MTGQTIQNTQIAKLNDLAFKAVRHRGLQKKLDERAIKNEENYKKIDKQIKNYVAKLNITELKEQHKDVITFIGNCPMSCNDTIEAISSQDCMCLSLDIGRSEATIADPTKLVIKDIIPTFMSADSFLDSAAFALKKNPDAAGGFSVKNPGNLALGGGRESISGIFPLYLFKEHWEISRKKCQPAFGFMCTLDIMGYAPSQFYAIPFLVLEAALKKKFEEKKEIYDKIYDLVLETCIQILKGNEEFQKQIKKSVTDFLAKPECRTIDVTASLKVFYAQMFTLTKIEGFEAGMEAPLNEENLNWIYRWAMEEQMRRFFKDKEPLNRTQVLSILDPDYSKFFDEIM